MPVRRVPLDELVESVLAGDVHSSTLMVSALAAQRLRERGWVGTRSVDEPWPTRPRRRGWRSCPSGTGRRRRGCRRRTGGARAVAFLPGPR